MAGRALAARRVLLASRVVCALASGASFRAPATPIRQLAAPPSLLPPAVCKRPSYARVTCSAAATDGTMVENNPLLTVSLVAGGDGQQMAAGTTQLHPVVAAAQPSSTASSSAKVSLFSALAPAGLPFPRLQRGQGGACGPWHPCAVGGAARRGGRALAAARFSL